LTELGKCLEQKSHKVGAHPAHKHRASVLQTKSKRTDWIRIKIQDLEGLVGKTQGTRKSNLKGSTVIH